MSVQLNHTIVRVRDKHESASFFADILGLPPAAPFGPFLVLETANGVSLDFADDHGDPVARPLRVPGHRGRVRRRSSTASRRAGCRTGPTRSTASRARSTPMTAAAACTGTTRTGTSWRSSPGPTEAVAST